MKNLQSILLFNRACGNNYELSDFIINKYCSNKPLACYCNELIKKFVSFDINIEISNSILNNCEIVKCLQYIWKNYSHDTKIEIVKKYDNNSDSILINGYFVRKNLAIELVSWYRYCFRCYDVDIWINATNRIIQHKQKYNYIFPFKDITQQLIFALLPVDSTLTLDYNTSIENSENSYQRLIIISNNSLLSTDLNLILIPYKNFPEFQYASGFLNIKCNVVNNENLLSDRITNPIILQKNAILSSDIIDDDRRFEIPTYDVHFKIIDIFRFVEVFDESKMCLFKIRGKSFGPPLKNFSTVKSRDMEILYKVSIEELEKFFKDQGLHGINVDKNYDQNIGCLTQINYNTGNFIILWTKRVALTLNNISLYSINDDLSQFNPLNNFPIRTLPLIDADILLQINNHAILTLSNLPLLENGKHGFIILNHIQLYRQQPIAFIPYGTFSVNDLDVIKKNTQLPINIKLILTKWLLRN